MKNEDEINPKDNQNKGIINSLITYNSYNSNDFKKIISSNNIVNTSGSQPIVIFKKISKSLTQIFPNKKLNKPNNVNKNKISNINNNQSSINKNYISDGGLRKKLNKYKSVNPNEGNNHRNKIKKGSKTMRNVNKKLIVNKKANDKYIKSKEKTQIIERENDMSQEKENEKEKNNSKNKILKVNKEKDKSKTEYHNKESHSQGHFNRKNKMLNNNYISKSVNGIYINNSKSNNNINCHIIRNINKNQNNIFITKKKDIKKKKNSKNENEECEKMEQEKKRIEYVDALIKNGISNLTKEFNFIKKLTPKEILNKRKKDYLQENGIIGNDSNDIEKSVKYQKKSKVNNINIKSMKKKNISTKNYMKNKSNNKLNISKSNSRFISFVNNNTNNNTNITNTRVVTNQDAHPVSKYLIKKPLKPQINQFEYLNRIQEEQKKLPTHKNEFSPKRENGKYLDTNEDELKLSDSFRHETKNNIIANNCKKISKNSMEHYLTKKAKKEKIIEEYKDDEFPFSHRKSYRSPKEIYRYLKEKRIENKKEEENTEKEKKLKAYMTYQNLMNIEKNLESNITKIAHKLTSMKQRKENKGHMKVRKEPNEYYVGTESSKNNSTFIDKKEYYISILESQKCVNNSKIKQDKEVEKKNNENFDYKQNNKEIKNKRQKRKLKKGFSSEFFENKKIMNELFTSINKRNKIIPKENLNQLKNNCFKSGTDINLSNNENDNIIITTETDDNYNCEINNYDNYKFIRNNKIIKRPKNFNYYNFNYNNKNKNNASNDKNKLFSYSFSYNNLNVLNSKDKINPKFSNSYSSSMNTQKKLEKKAEEKILSNLINKLEIALKRNMFKYFYNLYMIKYKKETYSLACSYLLFIFKIYPFKKIEKYSRVLEYFEAFKELLKPFIHSKFKKFVRNCLELKIRKFIYVIETFYKYSIMNKLYIYCKADFKTEIINFLIMTIKKPFFDDFINKLIYFVNERNNDIIENNNNMLNFPSLSNNLLNKIINQNETKLSSDKGINYIEQKNDLIEEDLNFEENNIINYNNNNSLSDIENKSFHKIKHKDVGQKKEEFNTHLNIKNLINLEKNNNNFDLKELLKIKDPEKFSDILTNLIIEELLKSEIKPFSPYEKLVPFKSFKYDSLQKSQNTSLNNSYISSSCASIDQLSMNNNNSHNDSRIMALNESLISQMSYNSEFNKTIKDKKREQSMSIYVKKIGPKLVELICIEVKNNYNRIYDNISTPLRTDLKEIIIALMLKDNELLKQNYRFLTVKEELKEIINRKKIINEFSKINRKIRKKYNQDKIDESFDIFLNLSIIDTAIEIISKERIYGEVGEPFSLNSIRKRELMFKYQKNKPKKLVQLVYNSLMEYLNNPIFLIKDSILSADEKKITKWFKKDLEEEQCQWEDMEIVETQSKLEVTELIIEQLYNEIIEILEHVQLSRKKSELYHYKSIYACEDIPKLSFQQITENDLIQEGNGIDIIGP